MILEGDTTVIDALKEKKRLLESGQQHDYIRPLLIVGGGFMQGVYGVGTVSAMDDCGFNDVFDYALGVSAGAPTVSYLLGNNTDVGRKVIYEDLCSKDFLNFFRWPDPVDSHFVKKITEGGTGKPICGQRIVDHRTDFRVGVSDFETAEPLLIKPDTEQDLYDAIRASAAIPGLVSEKIYVNNLRCADGSSTNPQILRHGYGMFDATHVLLVANQDKDDVRVNWLERLILHTVYRNRLNPKLLDAALHRRQRRHRFITEKLAEQEKPFLVSWGDNFIRQMEQDPVYAEKGVERSRVFWKSLLV